jgi:hypothetical protein
MVYESLFRTDTLRQTRSSRTLQFIFTYTTTRFHSLSIKITHLHQFRLIVLPPLHSIGLRIRDPVPTAPIMLARIE